MKESGERGKSAKPFNFSVNQLTRGKLQAKQNQRCVKCVYARKFPTQSARNVD